MKIDVPYYESKSDTDCGPLALKMALEYLGEEHSFEKIAEYERPVSIGMVWSVGIARAAKKFGFPVKFVSMSNFGPEDELDFYKKHANDEARIVLKELLDDLKEMNVKMEEKDMGL